MVLVERKNHRHFLILSRNMLGMECVSFTLLCLFFELGSSCVNEQSYNPQSLDPNHFPFYTSSVLQGLKKSFRCVRL